MPLRRLRRSRWASYAHPGRRQKWHEAPRALAVREFEDSVAGRALRQSIERRMTGEVAARCGLSETGCQSLQPTLRRGWYYVPETFRKWLLDKAGELLGKRSRIRRTYHGEEIKAQTAHGEDEARTLSRRASLHRLEYYHFPSPRTHDLVARTRGSREADHTTSVHSQTEVRATRMVE